MLLTYIHHLLYTTLPTHLLSYMHYLQYLTLPAYSTLPNMTCNALAILLTYIHYFLHTTLLTHYTLPCATLLSYMYYLQYMTLPSYSAFHHLVCQGYDSSETLDALNI